MGNVTYCGFNPAMIDPSLDLNPETDLGLLQHLRWKPLTIITKRSGSVLDVAAALEPPLKPTTEQELNVFLGHHRARTQISISFALQEITPATTAYATFHYILFQVSNWLSILLHYVAHNYLPSKELIDL